jgi:hypothetical protein
LPGESALIELSELRRGVLPAFGPECGHLDATQAERYGIVVLVGCCQTPTLAT